MSNVVNLRPPMSAPKVKQWDGEDYVNVPGIMKIAQDGDTPQCRALVCFYSAEWRALEGKPLSVKQRETVAFLAAHKRMVARFGVPEINWLERGK